MILFYIGGIAVILGAFSLYKYWITGGSITDLWNDENTK